MYGFLAQTGNSWTNWPSGEKSADRLRLPFRDALRQVRIHPRKTFRSRPTAIVLHASYRVPPLTCLMADCNGDVDSGSPQTSSLSPMLNDCTQILELAYALSLIFVLPQSDYQTPNVWACVSMVSIHAFLLQPTGRLTYSARDVCHAACGCQVCVAASSEFCTARACLRVGFGVRPRQISAGEQKHLRPDLPSIAALVVERGAQVCCAPAMISRSWGAIFGPCAIREDGDGLSATRPQTSQCSQAAPYAARCVAAQYPALYPLSACYSSILLSEPERCLTAHTHTRFSSGTLLRSGHQPSRSRPVASPCSLPTSTFLPLHGSSPAHTRRTRPPPTTARLSPSRQISASSRAAASAPSVRRPSRDPRARAGGAAARAGASAART